MDSEQRAAKCSALIEAVHTVCLDSDYQATRIGYVLTTHGSVTTAVVPKNTAESLAVGALRYEPRFTWNWWAGVKVFNLGFVVTLLIWGAVDSPWVAVIGFGLTYILSAWAALTTR